MFVSFVPKLDQTFVISVYMFVALYAFIEFPLWLEQFQGFPEASQRIFGKRMKYVRIGSSSLAGTLKKRHSFRK